MIQDHRLKIVNEILPLLIRAGRIESVNNRIVFHWVSGGKDYCRQWSSSSNFYPPFHNKMSCGGVTTTAVTQLINWVRDKPVLTTGTWEYWFSKAVGLKHGEKILPLLILSDYPKVRECQWCKRVDIKMDWWTLGNKSGLGCFDACDEINKHRNKLCDQSK